MADCKNVIVDNCTISNVQTGVFAFNSVGIQVKSNTIKGIRGSERAFVKFENSNADICDPGSNKAVDNIMQ